MIYGDGSTTMDFVYVRDIAKANIAALQADVTDEAFNIGNCEETSLKGLLDVLLKVNDSTLKPEFREENSINPVSRRLADISKAQRTAWVYTDSKFGAGNERTDRMVFFKNQSMLQPTLIIQWSVVSSQ